MTLQRLPAPSDAQGRLGPPGAADVVRWLLDAGVPVDLRDEEQQTALHYAVLAEQEDVRGRRVDVPSLLPPDN